MKNVQEILDQAVEALNQLQEYYYVGFGCTPHDIDSDMEQEKQRDEIEAAAKEAGVYYFHDNRERSVLVGPEGKLIAIAEKTALDADRICKVDSWSHYDIMTSTGF